LMGYDLELERSRIELHVVCFLRLMYYGTKSTPMVL
jgi:hypothetical protein